jgi:hypothetical protein
MGIPGLSKAQKSCKASGAPLSTASSTMLYAVCWNAALEGPGSSPLKSKMCSDTEQTPSSTNGAHL